MVRDGTVIGHNVSVYMYSDGGKTLLSISYVDYDGILNKTVSSIHDYKFTIDMETKTIDGILPIKEDWYLFWRNNNSIPV